MLALPIALRSVIGVFAPVVSRPVMDTLRQWERRSQGRLPEPSACCVDSQSIKTATQDQDVGFDGHKKVKGRKRSILVDTLGLIVAVVVTAANVDDRQGLMILMTRYVASGIKRVRKIGADGASKPSGEVTGSPSANRRIKSLWKSWTIPARAFRSSSTAGR